MHASGEVRGRRDYPCRRGLDCHAPNRGTQLRKSTTFSKARHPPDTEEAEWVTAYIGPLTAREDGDGIGLP